MTAQSWHAIPLLIGLATSFGCSHPVAAPIAVLPEDPPDNEEIGPFGSPPSAWAAVSFGTNLSVRLLCFLQTARLCTRVVLTARSKRGMSRLATSRQSFAAHKGAVSSLALSPDGQVLATGWRTARSWSGIQQLVNRVGNRRCIKERCYDRRVFARLQNRRIGWQTGLNCSLVGFQHWQREQPHYDRRGLPVKSLLFTGWPESGNCWLSLWSDLPVEDRRWEPRSSDREFSRGGLFLR